MKLTLAQEQYLDTHRNIETKDLALATGLSVTRVKNWLDKNPAKTTLPVEIPKTKELTEADGDVKIGKYIIKEGSVIMTAGQSQDDDEYQSPPVEHNPKLSGCVDRTPLKKKRIVPRGE